MSRTKLEWYGFTYPKNGHAFDEFEDAFAADAKSGRFAVADGASESSYAGEWAGVLASGFVANSPFAPDTTWSGWLNPLQKSWKAEIEANPSESESWFVQEKRQDGAFATFLGLEFINEAAEQTWQAAAVGDSCLFLIRQSQLKLAFPLTTAAEFNLRPPLFNSQSRKLPVIQQKAGNFFPGDTFLLMTDALGHWFLDQHAYHNNPWDDLLSFLESPDPVQAFQEWVEEARKNNALKNDDTTLMMIEVVAN